MNEVIEKRDKLAKNRTLLANERTLLAYIRTMLALIGLGIFLIKYDPTDVSIVIGVFLIIIAVAVTITGIVKYTVNRKKIDKY